MDIRIQDLGKTYQGNVVFRHVDLRLEEGGVYCLTAPSGAGKTTLLRILLGLEAPDEGRVDGLSGRPLSAVFQEDRLCPSLDAAGNIRLAAPAVSREALRQELLALLPADSLEKPVSAFSGGMRRRVSLLRALLSPGEVLFFDEPFNGLDEKSRQAALDYVRAKRAGRTLLFTTHHPEEAQALGARHFLWEEARRSWREPGAGSGRNIIQHQLPGQY